jgi:hypothetical protein
MACHHWISVTARAGDAAHSIAAIAATHTRTPTRTQSPLFGPSHLI